MQDILHIRTISSLHKTFGLPKPSHPLISIIRQWPETDFDFGKFRLTSDLYLLSMKENFEGGFQYGRNSYDFDDGTLVFMSPGQVAKFDNSTKDQADSEHVWEEHNEFDTLLVRPRLRPEGRNE